jgi:hypothetical protein
MMSGMLGERIKDALAERLPPELHSQNLRCGRACALKVYTYRPLDVLIDAGEKVLLVST